jgi:hypothetical protein
MSKSYRHQGNRELYDAMQERRRSSATTPIPSGKKYKRKSKHQNRKWEE